MSDLRKKVSLIIADDEVKNLRLDRFISENLKLFSRSQIAQHSVEAFVNEKPAKLSRKVSKGDSVAITYATPQLFSYEPEEIELDILSENEDVIVLNKDQGVVVHPAAGNRTGTLVQGLLFHCESLGESFEGEHIRPGIVHRLDKDTSGVIIAAKNPKAQGFLSAQFRRRKTKKKYYALIKGPMVHREGVIETFIMRDRRNRKRFAVSDHDGKHAETHFRTLKSWDRYSFVALAPVTGRTHQLRVHMKHLNHTIVGDEIYGRRDNAMPEVSLMLHAYSLAIRLPGDEKPRVFRTPLPARFKKTIKAIEDLQKRD